MDVWEGTLGAMEGTRSSVTEREESWVVESSMASHGEARDFFRHV